jgi:LysM repeat protein
VKALNPFNAPGSPQAEQRRLRRERFKFVVWTIVVANVLLLMGMLIQGCQREPATSEASGGETNGTAMTQPTPDTNAPVEPTFNPPVTNATAEATATSAAPKPVQEGAKQYVVVKGDSFYKIARANGISMKALADTNPSVNSAKLKVGQVLELPAGAEPATTKAVSARTHSSAAVSASSSRYVVKSGDTLDRIARAHRTTVKAIKLANGLTSDRITVGRVLKLSEPRATKGGGVQV